MSQTRSITLTLPLPPPRLSPNARVHWATKAREAKLYRARCRFDVRLPDGWQPLAAAGLTLHCRYCGRRQALDADNAGASFKAGLDGLVDAGVLVDDGPQCVRWCRTSTSHCPRRCTCLGYVTVTLEEVATP